MSLPHVSSAPARSSDYHNLPHLFVTQAPFFHEMVRQAARQSVLRILNGLCREVERDIRTRSKSGHQLVRLPAVFANSGLTLLLYSLYIIWNRCM